MTPRVKIQLGTGIMDMLATMAEGNLGAISVMAKMKEERGDRAFITILSLDDMNIRGTQIWMGYKYHCDSDIDKFLQAVDDRDQAMVDTINRECAQDALIERAVPHGASFTR